MRFCTPSGADLSGSTSLRAQGVTLRLGGDTQMLFIARLFAALADSINWI